MLTTIAIVMGMLNNTPSLICGVVPEDGLLDREGIRRLIDVSIEFFAQLIRTYLGERIGSMKLRIGRDSSETGE
jgi:hypothetical protein